MIGISTPKDIKYFRNKQRQFMLLISINLLVLMLNLIHWHSFIISGLFGYILCLSIIHFYVYTKKRNVNKNNTMSLLSESSYYNKPPTVLIPKYDINKL